MGPSGIPNWPGHKKTVLPLDLRKLWNHFKREWEAIVPTPVLCESVSRLKRLVHRK